MRIFLILALVLLGYSTHAEAGWQIDQRVNASLEGQSSDGTYVWLIDDGRFKLTTKSLRGEAIYLFNGKNLYVCGKFVSKDNPLLNKSPIDTSQLLARYKDGACQAVPYNFMARFFLAQTLAAESLDRADGMEVNLKLSEYKLTRLSSQGKFAGKTCENLQRLYQVKKTSDINGTYAISAQETMCIAANLPWRLRLWTEVSKAIIRQPGGGGLFAQLKKDHEQISGFPLNLVSQYTLSTPDGKKREGLVEVKTLAIESVELADRSFQLPTGYKVFAPEDIRLARTSQMPGPAKNSSETKAGSDNSQGGSLEQVVQTAQSLFLCAISRSLACVFNE